MNWKLILIVTGIFLVLLVGGLFVYSKMSNQTMEEIYADTLEPILMFAKPIAYALTDVEEAADTSTTINEGQTVTIHCRAFQPYSGTDVGAGLTCHHYMQWNDSTTAWIDIPTSGTVYMATNPTLSTSDTINADTWWDLTAYDVTFATAGTYNIRCREPSETCSNSVVLTSDTWIEVLVEEEEEPSNCWIDITGGIYVPEGCTYYIEGGASSYIT